MVTSDSNELRPPPGYRFLEHIELTQAEDLFWSFHDQTWMTVLPRMIDEPVYERPFTTKAFNRYGIRLARKTSATTTTERYMPKTESEEVW